MPDPKTGKSRDGRKMHYSVGALIESYGKYLLIDRRKEPFGFAGIAGHVDEGEEALQALKREVLEETGLKAEEAELLLEEEVPWNWCRRGIKVHYWYLYKCKVSGEAKQNKEEEKSIAWYSVEEIKKLELEEVWKHWLEKLGILQKNKRLIENGFGSAKGKWNFKRDNKNRF